MDRILGQKVATFFTIIGTIATIISAYLAYLVFISEEGEYAANGVYKLQEAAAKVIAPKGFVVKPADLHKVPDNHDFSVEARKALLITNKNIPFMVMRHRDDNVYVTIDGRSRSMYFGIKTILPNTNCTLWLYSIENGIYSFHMKCS